MIISLLQSDGSKETVHKAGCGKSQTMFASRHRWSSNN
jgi:hypothetical protein